jgi:hypothetical protein
MWAVMTVVAGTVETSLRPKMAATRSSDGTFHT